jgi:DNA polymerase III delta' subunit
MMTPAQVEQCQPGAVAQLRCALARRRLPHGIILASPGDVGERELAGQLAATLLCEAPQGPFEPCGACAACRQVAQQAHADLHVVSPKGLLRAIKTEDMLAMIQALQATPLAGGAKVGIVYQAETLRKESANRFLKTLEEPTPRTYFILVTTRLERLLPTIRSRCQVVRLAPLNEDVMRTRVEAELGLQGEDAELVCAVARGRWRRATQLAAELAEYRRLLTTFARILSAPEHAAAQAVDIAREIGQAFRAAREAFNVACKDELARRGDELQDVDPSVRREILNELELELKSAQASEERDAKAALFESLIELWRDVWVWQTVGARAALVNRFLASDIAALATRYNEARILRNLNDIELVRGPTVYLNAKLDVVLQGLLAQGAAAPGRRVPLRGAVAASGL